MILETNARERREKERSFVLIGVTVANANGNGMSSIYSFRFVNNASFTYRATLKSAKRRNIQRQHHFTILNLMHIYEWSVKIERIRNIYIDHRIHFSSCVDVSICLCTNKGGQLEADTYTIIIIPYASCSSNWRVYTSTSNFLSWTLIYLFMQNGTSAIFDEFNQSSNCSFHTHTHLNRHNFLADSW